MGSPPRPGDEKLQEASADALLKREERGRDTTSTFIAQIAIVGTFIGAFSLLNDAAKAAVVQSEWSFWALVAAAVSLGFSLSTYVVLPGRMPPLSHVDGLRDFWNKRALWRKVLLTAALIALGFAIAFATAAIAEARDVVAPKPAASVSAKFTPVKNAPGSLESTATWSGLEPGEYAIVCVTDGIGNELGAAVGVAANDGKQTTTLTVPVPAKSTGDVTITTVRLASAPQKGTELLDTCRSEQPPRVGQPTQSSIWIKDPPGRG